MLIFFQFACIIADRKYKNRNCVFIGGIILKLLQISARGLPLFKKELVLTFYAQQRVSESHRNQLFQLHASSGYYINCVNALIGINASGKTSALKVILLSLNILNNEPINHIEVKDILGGSQRVTLSIVFMADSNEFHPLLLGKAMKRFCRMTRVSLSRITKSTTNKHGSRICFL